MSLGIKLVGKCSVLNEREKELLIRIDGKGEKLTDVARSLGLGKSTISTQRKKARKKFLEWKEKTESPFEANLDKYVFNRLNHSNSPWAIIADIGHADEVIELSKKWRQLHEDDYWATRNLLNSYGLMQGFEEEEQPLAKAVESVVDSLDREIQDFNAKVDEYKTLKDRFVEVTNKLSNVSNKLDEAEAEIERLSRLRKYEELSEEERQALQAQVDSLKGEISDLEGRVKELETLEASLQWKVVMVEQVKADLERNVQGVIFEWMADRRLSDVLDLYMRARRRVEKTIAW